MSEVILEDGGEKIVKCGCGKSLFTYRIYGKVDLTNKIKFNCPFCKDLGSIDINGLFWYGPIGQDQSINATTIVDIEEQSDCFVFKIGRK